MESTLFDPDPPVNRGATLSDDGRYRYDLWRRWDPSTESLGFIMCNPSTADADVDDPTIRRCIGFALRFGFGGIVVRNLYAWRATRPRDLAAARRRGEDIIGPDNARWLNEMATSTNSVVAAWGSLAALRQSRRYWDEVDRYALATIEMFDGRLFQLGNSDYPPHPLYLRADTPLVAAAWRCR